MDVPPPRDFPPERRARCTRRVDVGSHRTARERTPSPSRWSRQRPTRVQEVPRRRDAQLQAPTSAVAGPSAGRPQPRSGRSPPDANAYSEPQAEATVVVEGVRVEDLRVEGREAARAQGSQGVVLTANGALFSRDSEANEVHRRRVNDSSALAAHPVACSRPLRPCGFFPRAEPTTARWCTSRGLSLARVRAAPKPRPRSEVHPFPMPMGSEHHRIVVELTTERGDAWFAAFSTR